MESRVARYSKKNRIKRNLKKFLKRTLKQIFRNIIYLIVGLLYAIYLIIRAFNNLVVKFFLKLPRLMRVIIIYLLVINVVTDFYNIYKIEANYQKIFVNRTTINSELVNNAIVEEKQEICLFDSTSCFISEKAKELGLNEEQILISIAISKWETGNYTSVAFLEKNNVGGMMCGNGLINYNSLEEGVVAFLSNLKNNYFDVGLDTLDKIQPKYCPIGAVNDPNGLNKYWLNGTKKMYNELISK